MWIINIYNKSTGLLTNTFWGVGTEPPNPFLKEDEAIFSSPMCVEPYEGYIDLKTNTFIKFSEEEQLNFKMKDLTGAVWDPLSYSWVIPEVFILNSKKDELFKILKVKQESKINSPIEVKNYKINADRYSLSNLQSKLTELSSTKEDSNLFWRDFSNNFITFENVDEMIEWVTECISLISKRTTDIKKQYWELTDSISSVTSEESLEIFSDLVEKW